MHTVLQWSLNTKAYFNFFLVFGLLLLSPNFSAQTKTIDSLLQQLELLQKNNRNNYADTNRLNIYNALASKLFSTNKVESALAYADSAFSFASKYNYEPQKIRAMFNTGIINIQTGNYSKALKFLEDVNRIYETKKYAFGIAECHGNIGSVYFRTGNYPMAVTYHLKALAFWEARKDKKLMAQCYNNIAGVYAFQKNTEEALKNHFMSLKLKKELEDKKGIGASYNNIGLIFYDKKNYKIALSYFDSSLVLRKEIDDQRGLGSVYNNIGNVLGDMSEDEKAIECYLNSAKFKELTGDKYGYANSISNLGHAYLKSGNAKESEKYLNEALKISLELGALDVIKNTFGYLSALDTLQNNYGKALKDFKFFVLYKDSMNNEASTKKTVQIEMQYEFDKKENAQMAEQEKKDALSAEELKQQKLVQRFMVYGLLVVVLAALLILRSFLQKKKANKLLEEKNILIERQKRIVDMKQKEIIDSIYYAKRIQNALITSEHLFEKYLKNLNRQ